MTEIFVCQRAYKPTNGEGFRWKCQAFGTGVPEGVAAPEAANNASAQTSFIPLLTLGLPANPTIAMMAGAMMIQGIQPGPQVMANQPDLFWGLIGSMLIGNILLVIINLPLVRIWIALLRVPYRFFYQLILVCCCVGAYSINNNVFDVYIMIIFGFVGYLLLKCKLEPSPLILAFVLGPMAEEHLRRAMLISNEDPSVFVARPLSLAFLFVAAAMIIFMLRPYFSIARLYILKKQSVPR